MPRDAKEIILDRAKAKVLVGEPPAGKKPYTDKELLSKVKNIFSKDAKKEATESFLHKIKDSFVKNGAIKQSAALDFIYPKDPLEIIPVIIQIIEDLIKSEEERKKESRNPSKSAELLKMAHVIMLDVDRKQNLGIFEKKEALKDLNKEKIKKDMNPLIAVVNQIDVHEADLLLWYELVLWLEGSYLHVHNAALEYFKGELKYEKDPEIVSDYDWEDTALKTLTGVTKHYIQEFFHLFAEKLQSQIVLRLQAKSSVGPILAPIPTTKEFTHAIKNVGEGKFEVVISVHGFSQQQIEEALKLFLQPVSAQTEFGAIEDQLQLDEGSIEEIIAEDHRKDKLLDVLQQGKDLSSELLFTLIVDGLKRCVLTGREDNIVCTHVANIKATLTSKYINNSWNGSLPTRLFSARTHAQEVEEAIKRMEKRETALGVMKDLYNLWVIAINDNSTTLKPALEKIGKDLYTLLVTKLSAVSEPTVKGIGLANTGS